MYGLNEKQNGMVLQLARSFGVQWVLSCWNFWASAHPYNGPLYFHLPYLVLTKIFSFGQCGNVCHFGLSINIFRRRTSLVYSAWPLRLHPLLFVLCPQASSTILTVLYAVESWSYTALLTRTYLQVVLASFLMSGVFLDFEVDEYWTNSFAATVRRLLYSIS